MLKNRSRESRMALFYQGPGAAFRAHSVCVCLIQKDCCVRFCLGWSEEQKARHSRQTCSSQPRWGPPFGAHGRDRVTKGIHPVSWSRAAA